MKNYQEHLPAGLLVAYAVYSAFTPITIAHSIILFALAALCGYQAYLTRQENTKYNQKVLEQMKHEFESKYSALKEAHEKKLSKLEDEVAKMALNSIPPKATASSPVPRKVVF